MPQKDSKELRRALHQGLIQLMMTSDFEAITVEMLISQAGIARRTFYRYYENKSDLMWDCLRRFRELHFKEWRTAVEKGEIRPGEFGFMIQILRHIDHSRPLWARVRDQSISTKFRDALHTLFRALVWKDLLLRDPSSSRAQVTPIAGAMWVVTCAWLDGKLAGNPEQIENVIRDSGIGRRSSR